MRYLADRSDVRAHAQVALLLALAVVLGYLEAVLVPPLPVAGVRLGIANLAVIVALSRFGPKNALIVSLGRVVIVGLALGTLAGPVGAMSAAGACASWATMSALWRAGSRFSPVGWSVAGASAHVVAQLAVASIFIGSSAILGWAPISLAASLPTGLAVGLCARLLISRISRPEWSVAGV